MLYGALLLNDRTDAAPGKQRSATGLNMFVTGDASPTLCSLDKRPFQSVCLYHIKAQRGPLHTKCFILVARGYA